MHSPAPITHASTQWPSRAFLTYLSGQTLSALGDAFAIVATPLLVLRATGSLRRMGLLSAAVSVAYLLSGLFAGAIVDSVDRRRLMIGCDLARFAVWMLVPIVWTLHGPNYWLLVGASCASALLGNAFQIASITAIANLVPRARLIDANGWMHGAWAAMFFVGPMLAGVVCDRVGPVPALALDALTFLLSAASLANVRAPFSRGAPGTRGNAVAEFLTGLRFLWEHPTLRATIVLLGTSSMLMAGRENLVVYYIKHDLHRRDRAVGGVFAAAAAGSVLASLMAARLRARFGFAACWLTAGVVLGASVMGFGASRALPWIVACVALVGFSDTIRGINTMTLRQEITPDHLLGRVTAAFWTTLNVPASIGALWTTALAERVGVPRAVALLGGGVVALMLVGARTSITHPVDRPPTKTAQP